MAKKKLTVEEACSRSKQLKRLQRQLTMARKSVYPYFYVLLMEALHERLDQEIADIKDPARTDCLEDDIIIRLFATLLGGYDRSGNAHSRVNSLIKMLSSMIEDETNVSFPPLPKSESDAEAA